VARELGVRYVLEGSVRKAGNRVRIIGQLIDTTSDAHIWADRFDGALDDIFELQDQVAGSVVGAIEPKLRQSEIERAARKPTESLNAYDLYLRALALRHKHTEKDIREAIALTKRALAIDPSYAPAAAMIGWCRIHQVSHGGSPVSESEAEEAVSLARRAIEDGKEDSESLWMAAATLSILAGEHAVAASVIDRALTLNPNSAHAWMACGYVSSYRNLPDAAIESLERAMRLSPLDLFGRAFTAGVALAHLIAGQYGEAAEWADQSLCQEPNYVPAISFKVASCAHLGRIDEARDALRLLLELRPGLTITSLRLPKLAPEMVTVYAEGFRRAGLPEE